MLYKLENVRVAFAGREVLRGVDFQHNPGEKIILLGRNGCGKTTLIRVILGEQEVESGSVERARGLEIAHLEQRLLIDPQTPVLNFCLTAYPRLLDIEAEIAALEHHQDDNEIASRLHALHEELEHMDGFRARPRAQAALEGLGVRPDMHQRPIGSLSGGERTRVALARALLSPAGLLLLDEPTNHLDLVGVEYLAEELARRQKALLVVTHDRELVDRVGGGIIEMHGGKIETYPAGYVRYRRERDTRRAQARKAWELQRAEIERQEEFIRRNMAGQNTKQAQARQKLLAKVERLEAPEPDLEPVKLRWPTSGRSGDRVLETTNLTIGWDRPLLRGIDLILRRGERMAVVGRNGSGKTTLLNTLSGRIPALSGGMKLGANVMPGWYDQEQIDIPDGTTVLAVLLEARPDWTPAEARAWAGRFAFSGEAAEGETRTLSGGERARLALARLIAIAPNLMLLDEPTNHLDLVTCEVLETALMDFPGAVVLISHDRRLVEKVATGVLLLDGEHVVPMNSVEAAFSTLGLTVVGRSDETEDRPKGPRRSASEEERRRLKREASRARQIAIDLADQLHQTEARLAEVDALLCDPQVYSNHVTSLELTREAESLRGTQIDLGERWIKAEEHADSLERQLAEIES